MAYRATLKDVAAAAGVSVTTVSLVLNNRPARVSEEKRKAIADAAKKLNYVPNQSARSLVTKQSQLVALIVPDIENLFFAALATHQESFEEAQQEAEEAAKLTVNDVADGTTLETLKDAITLAKAVESAPACPASGNASDFTKATDDIRKYADNLRNITNELDAAAKSVVASQELRLESAE